MEEQKSFSSLDCTDLMKNTGATKPVEIKDIIPIKFGSSVVSKDYIVLDGELESNINYLKLKGVLNYSLEMECSRCLDISNKNLHSNIEAIFTLDAEDEALRITENMTINLEGVIAATITDSLDMKYLCFNDCLGICPECGANKNTTKCSHNIDKKINNLKENPFSSLNELNL